MDMLDYVWDVWPEAYFCGISAVFVGQLTEKWINLLWSNLDLGLERQLIKDVHGQVSRSGTHKITYALRQW